MKKINLKKIFSGRNAAISLLILAVVFLFGKIVLADGFGTWAGNVVGGIIAVFITAIASILMLLVRVLMDVAAYSDFIHAGAIVKGWVIVRDVCNMFFVVILLIIAFATILGQEEYGAKKMLPKLIMAAVLINFSKMFCGLMIDIASVVMLTFVNAFSSIGSGNMLDLLGISKITSINPNSGAITFATIVSAYIFGLIYVLVATVVVASMLGMLVMRVVMIWILVVLSPLAFFLQAVPGKGAQYASQWWSKWSSNLIVGPVLAFFIWLAFAALQGGSPIITSADPEAEQLTNKYAATSTTNGIGSEAGTVSEMAKFVIAIGMLLGGMKIAQEVGGETGAALGKGMGYISKGKSMAIGGVSALGGYAVGAVTGSAKWAGKKAAAGAGDLALTAIGNMGSKDPITGKRSSAVGNIALQWRDDMKGSRQKAKNDSREKFLKKIGFGEKTSEKAKDVLNNLSTQGFLRSAKNIATGSGLGGFGGGALAGTLAAGPVGAVIGGVMGAISGGVIGNFAGAQSKNKYNKAKIDKTNYENNLGPEGKNEDAVIAEGFKARKKINNKAKMTTAEEQAVMRIRSYNKNSQVVANREKNPIFKTTISAMDSMTKKKKSAQDWVSMASKNPLSLKGAGKGGIYADAVGMTEVWNKRLDELNGGSPEALLASVNLSSQISNQGAGSLKPGILEELAKLIAAYEKKGGTSIPGGVGELKSALSSLGNPNYNPATYTGQVFSAYKKLGPNVAEVRTGQGPLAYNTFAANSFKNPIDRNSRKDIIGASFGQINAEAERMGMGSVLDEAEGAHQIIGGPKLNQISQVVSKMLDNEISRLNTTVSNPGVSASERAVAAEKIRQATVSKERLSSGSLSGLSLDNSDVVYQGTDSEQRAARYNATQHEIIHSAGAKNEDLVQESADALGDARLIGRIPNSNGQSYDQEVGKMIAGMESVKADPAVIRQVVASQIDSWKPSNAQRVLETESGERDSVKDVVFDTREIVDAINKSALSTNKNIRELKPKESIDPTKVIFAEVTNNFIRKQNKEMVKPLEAMAATAKDRKKNEVNTAEIDVNKII
ncbi:MAG: hypothetical protein WCK59_01010 [Candidatus Falkowbacteria bacterium]